MQYKDLQNKIHDDMGGKAIHLLPVGCVAITESEAAAIRLAENPPPPPPTAAELKMIADIAAVKADAVIKTLEGLTDAQIDTYFLANVTTLAQVIALLNRIVKFARTASRRL